MEILVLGDDFAAHVPITEAQRAPLLASYRCPNCMIGAYRNQLGNVVVGHIRDCGCLPDDGLAEFVAHLDGTPS